MGEYGYTNENWSSYGSRRDEALGPAIRKPFVPYVPNSNRNPHREEYVTSPYGYGDGDEYSRHGYCTRDDDEYRRRQTSPVHSHPQRFTPAATTERRAEYGYGNTNREGQYNYRGSVGSPVPNANYYYGNGYGDREWEKPSSGYSPNHNYDGYQSQPPISYTCSSSSRPKNNISSGGWTAPPRNGTQLSEPTNNIGKALQLLKQAARLKDQGYNSNSNSNFTNPHF